MVSFHRIIDYQELEGAHKDASPTPFVYLIKYYLAHFNIAHV